MLNNDMNNTLSESNGDGLKPEFLTVRAAARIFSISRSRLYRMIADKEIPSVNLRARGAVKGRRLIPYDALKDYMQRYLEGQD